MFSHCQHWKDSLWFHIQLSFHTSRNPSYNCRRVASITVPFAVSQVMRLRHNEILSTKNERRIMIASAVAIVAFLFFVPVVQTTAPPPTYHWHCEIPCMPFIATHVYGSTTYWFFGYGGTFPGHYADFRYYSVVWS